MERDDTMQDRWERWGAASGLAVVGFSLAAMVFERAPETAAEIAANRSALVTQSMLFLAGTAATLWFLGSLRVVLLRAEGGRGRLSTVAFGAGLAWAMLNMLAQTFQLGVADAPGGEAPAALTETMNAVFTVANLPLAVMLAAVAVVSLRHGAFPVWLGGISVAASLAAALLWLGTVIDQGPMAPTGWLSFVLYPFVLLWLVPAAVVMVRRAPSRPSPVTAGRTG